METTMTLSHLADLIIVIGFFSIIGAAVGHVIGELICLIADGIRERLKKHKERKAQALEESGAEQQQ